MTGCASIRRLGDLPSLEEEFNLPFSELQAKYPDISAYNEFLGHCTKIEEFITKLGEPTSIDIEHFQVPFISIPIGVVAGGPGGVSVVVIAYSMFPQQPKNYNWVKGKYSIRARTIKDISCGYNERVGPFTWDTTN